MEGTVLLDDGAAIDAHDFAVRIGLTDNTHGLGIKVGLSVGGHEDGTIDDQIVGVGGGQTVALVVYGTGQGEPEQAIGLVVKRAQRFELLFHECQIGMVGIATGIDDGVVGTDAYQRVDMSVGIVANQRAVVEPYDALGTEVFFEASFYLGLREGLITMGCHETAGSCEDGALAIALDGTAFEDEVQVGLIVALYATGIIEMAVDGIIQGCLKLIAPTVELEIKEDDVRGLRADV